MIRAVIDTNVLVSGLISSSGNEAVLLFAISQGRLQPCFSNDILEEYADVLRRPKFGFSEKEVQSLIELLRQQGCLANPREPSKVSRDPDDDKFIACALASNAQFLVTGNKKHFPQADLGDIQVVNARELIAFISLSL